MIGDGVIAESIVSFNIAWNSPGNGEQPEWDQNAQSIQLHSVDIYPDLLYTKAYGTATYFTHTSIDRILNIINRINSVIDAKLIELNEINEANDLSGVNVSSTVNVPGDESATSTKSANSDPTQPSDSPEKETEKLQASSVSYSVEVTADRLKLVDVQRRGGYGEIVIVHKVSENMIREDGDATNQNAKKINAVVRLGGILGRKIEMEFSDFDSDSGINSLVDILPSIELRFTPSEEAVVPKPEYARDEDSLMLDLSRLVKGTQMEKELTSANNFEKVKVKANK